MVQSTFKINQSFYDKLTKSKKSIEDKTKGKLKDIAQSLIEYSPVDTGAYSESFSVKANNTRSRGRRKSSDGLPRNQDTESKRSEGLMLMLQDIRAIDMEQLNKVTFRNDSPHARKVEDGWPFETKKAPQDGYGPFRYTKHRFR